MKVHNNLFEKRNLQITVQVRAQQPFGTNMQTGGASLFALP
jgi:hypothetical protein